MDNFLNKKIFLTIFFIATFLVGCSYHNDEIYLVRHPAKLISIVKKCNEKTLQQVKQDTKCIFTMRLYVHLVQLNNELEAGPVEYGKKILSLQIEKGKLQEKVNQLEKLLSSKGLVSYKRESFKKQLQNINSQIVKLDRQINIRVTLIAVAEGM